MLGCGADKSEPGSALPKYGILVIARDGTVDEALSQELLRSTPGAAVISTTHGLTPAAMLSDLSGAGEVYGSGFRKGLVIVRKNLTFSRNAQYGEGYTGRLVLECNIIDGSGALVAVKAFNANADGIDRADAEKAAGRKVMEKLLGALPGLLPR
ncbi:MAG: hypothetical protein QNK37_25315 [Acidobacteriota bacterium]|nr:hypothetical protein [Acidobacteriota bacterium]